MNESINEGDAIHSPRCLGSDFSSVSRHFSLLVDIAREVFAPFCLVLLLLPSRVDVPLGKLELLTQSLFGLCSLLRYVKASTSLIVCSISRSHLDTPLSVSTPSHPYPVSHLVLESLSLNDPQISSVSFVTLSLSHLA